MHAIKLGFPPTTLLFPSKPRVEISAAKRGGGGKTGSGRKTLHLVGHVRSEEGEEAKTRFRTLIPEKGEGEEKKRIDHCFSVSPRKTAFLDARVPRMVCDAKKGEKCENFDEKSYFFCVRSNTHTGSDGWNEDWTNPFATPAVDDSCPSVCCFSRGRFHRFTVRTSNCQKRGEKKWKQFEPLFVWHQPRKTSGPHVPWCL